MKTMLQNQVCSPIRNIVALTFIITVCSGLTHLNLNCSNYTIHESSTTFRKGRDWKTSRLLCQKSGEGDLVSIEEENERIFLKKNIEKLKTVKYYIGLEKEQDKWRWLSNGNSVNASTGIHPWSSKEPNGGPEIKCATIYGNYQHLDGLFDDMSCSYPAEDAGYICERALPCTKEGKAELTTVYKDTKRPTTTQSSPVSSTRQSEMTSTQPRGLSSTNESEKTKQVRTTITTSWIGLPDDQSTSGIDSIERATTNLERADESSYLITIIVSVLAFVILGTGIALWYFLVYRPRKNGSKSKIQGDHRRNNSTQLRHQGSLSPAEEEISDLESLPEVQRQDTCIDIEEGDRGSFLSMPRSSTKRQEEAFIQKQSSVDSSNTPLNISATTKASKKNNTSKAFIKKDTPEQHHVYAIVHINPKQDKAAFHLNPVMQDLGEGSSQLTVDEEECTTKASVGLSSSGLVKELTRNEEAIVEKPGQDQGNDCVYAIVDKTKKKRQPPKKPAPYHDLLYADLSHSPKKSDNERIQQESIATVYADIDHIKSSAMSDSRLQQENEVKLTE